MGGKGGGSSSTQVVIPPWIEAIMKPLLSGSATKLQEFQNQGWDVLQGNTPQTGVSLDELTTMETLANGTPMALPKSLPKEPQGYLPEGVGGGGGGGSI